MKKNVKTIIAIALALTLAVGLFFAFGNIFEEKVSYSEFTQQLENEKIEKAYIDEVAGKISYKLKNDTKSYYTAYPDSENFKEHMLKKGVELGISNDGTFRSFSNALTLIISAMMLILIISFIRPSNKFKVIGKDNLKTTFADVAGNDEVKDELIRISKMIKDDKFRQNGAKIPKGILLQGPPGNGKTLLARAFAGETGVNMIATTSGDFSSQFIGIGSMKIRQLFKAAKNNSPCVIFIDEIDGVGSKRMNAQQAADKEMNTILTALLNEIDGFKSSDNIMVLAATNRTDDLDDALTRPGRFDRQIIINKPDKKTRIELLKKYTQDSALADNIDFNNLSLYTYGYSSAQIEALCNEAVLTSISNGHSVIEAEDFKTAVLKTDIKGSLKNNSFMTEEDRKIAAYHEAGHAVIAYYYTDKDVTTVSIRPTTSGAGGFTMTLNANENQFETLGNIFGALKELYAGRAAEYILKAESLEDTTTGAAQDITQATKLALNYICLSEGIDLNVFGSYGVKESLEKVKKLKEKVWLETVENEKAHWDKIELLAHMLIENETVTGEEFRNIISKAENEFNS